MYKIIILLCHLLVGSFAGYTRYFNHHFNPYHSGIDERRTIYYTGYEPQTIRYNNAIRQPLYEKSLYYFGPPDEYFEQRHNHLMRKPTSGENNLQVIVVKSTEQETYENAVHNKAIEQEQQPQPNTQVYVIDNQLNVNSLRPNLQAAPLTVGIGRQQQIPEVHFINYETDAEADNVIQQVLSAHNEQIPPDSIVSHVSIHAAASPIVNSVRKPKLSGTSTSNIQAPLAVHKNYAMNYLPTGVDVVPGSSYIPLRRI